MLQLPKWYLVEPVTILDFCFYVWGERVDGTLEMAYFLCGQDLENGRGPPATTASTTSVEMRNPIPAHIPKFQLKSQALVPRIMLQQPCQTAQLRLASAVRASKELQAAEFSQGNIRTLLLLARCCRCRTLKTGAILGLQAQHRFFATRRHLDLKHFELDCWQPQLASLVTLASFQMTWAQPSSPLHSFALCRP